jgi:hypothetical protein
MKINLGVCTMLSYLITPLCFRTRYLEALARIFKKAEYRLHSELDIGVLLKNIRDSKSAIRSYSTSRVFNPSKLL